MISFSNYPICIWTSSWLLDTRRFNSCALNRSQLILLVSQFPFICRGRMYTFVKWVISTRANYQYLSYMQDNVESLRRSSKKKRLDRFVHGCIIYITFNISLSNAEISLNIDIIRLGSFVSSFCFRTIFDNRRDNVSRKWLQSNSCASISRFCTMCPWMECKWTRKRNKTERTK